MTDLDTAKAHLSGHSLCLCKDGAWFTDDGRGISPMLRLIGENRGLRGYAAADIIVGKAAAMLFVKAGISRSARHSLRLWHADGKHHQP